MPYEIDFYEEPCGTRPALRWLDGLSAPKQRAMAAAIKFYLQELGPNVCETKMGESVGGGIVEFKVWRDEDEIRAQFGESPRSPGKSHDKILLRLFCHFHGARRIILLSGYDKGRQDGKRAQQAAIARARRQLAEYKRRKPNS